MPKLPTVSAKKVVKVAGGLGYRFVRQSGSHLILKNGQGNVLVIPNHKALKKGTLLQVLKVLGITKEALMERL